MEIALKGTPESEEEKENSIDLLRAVIPTHSIFLLIALGLCTLNIYTGISGWTEGFMTLFFAFWIFYCSRIVWQSRKALKKMESRPEPVDADNQIARP